jgi:hypothetical protein
MISSEGESRDVARIVVVLVLEQRKRKTGAA